MSALADWEFGGGADYCTACNGDRSDCPRLLNQPHSLEGWQVWDLVQRAGGQLRVGGSLSPQVLGFDMSAVLTLGAALGVPPLAIAELLPGIERAMVQALSKNTEDTESLDGH